jgi:hypothetical protein
MGEIPHCTLCNRLTDNVQTVEDNRYAPGTASQKDSQNELCVKVLLLTGTRISLNDQKYNTWAILTRCSVVPRIKKTNYRCANLFVKTV